jgi:hypothetical protein
LLVLSGYRQQQTNLMDELSEAIRIAPLCRTQAEVAQRVNEALGCEHTAAAWRGLLNRNPEIKERVRKYLGTAVHRGLSIVPVNGNVKGAVTCDVHVPFHDRDALKLAAKVLEWWKPDVHVMAGDHLDCYSLSTYDKNPERTESLQDEVDAWHCEVVAPLSAAVGKKCRQIYLPGNHEQRLRKHLWRHPQLFGVRSIELANLLELAYYGIEYAELAVRCAGVLEISHGTRVSKWAGASARAEQELRRYTISTITGHVHRAGRFQTHTMRGTVIGQESPCLCSLEPEYMLYPDWVQGLTLFEVRDGRLWVEAVVFSSDYTCMVGGKVMGL